MRFASFAVPVRIFATLSSLGPVPEPVMPETAPAVPPAPQSLSPSGKALAAVPLSTIGGERGEGFGLGSLDLVSSADGGGAGSVDELVAFEASAAAGDSGVFAVNEVAPAPVEEAARSAATAAANDELAALLA